MSNYSCFSIIRDCTRSPFAFEITYLIGMVYYWNRQTVNLNRVSKNQRLIWVSCNQHRHIHRSDRFDIFHLAVRNSVAAAPLWHR